MADQATLLQLVQFVGLITPALAILIELLVGFHGGLKDIADEKKVPREVLLLFFGFGLILIGGMAIGIQLIGTIEGQSTQLAAGMVFIGLPFMALSVLGVNMKIYGISPEERGLKETLKTVPRLMVATGFPIVVVAIVFGIVPMYIQTYINNSINWWVFRGPLQPILYFYLIGGLLSFKVIYSLWSHGLFPNLAVREVVEPPLKGSFVVGVLWLVVCGPVFLLYYGMIVFNIPFISPISNLSSIPFIWGAFLPIVLLSPDIDVIE